ncbi:TldD/PmbA family protein [Sphingorhabdus sp.]|jgi:PmbA protein|uniref:TldD/PmbA family protein n=1 Tax=Sphingorhabdus sp. TaxID=1902408 RepID=UPI003BAEA781|nr:TldD/PmbA family protein [Sphingomonadales bacterium]MBK9432782.1 TldD/PmbA family protein [Sphingomonadales bacterium]MBL0022447.1 TldD/PmbA family protein [Sphingomonadales bacterium]
MLTPEAALDRAVQLVENAKKAGADAADAVYLCDASTEVQVRLGVLEDVVRSEGEDIGLRVFLGQRSATISSSSMNPDVLAGLVERALDMAREAPEDQFAGLAPQDMLLKGTPPAIDSDDDQDPDPHSLREAALACEDAARAVVGVTNSEGAGASAGRSIFALATSHGFAGVSHASGYGLSASVLAGEGDDKQRDYDWRSARHRADLDSAEAIGRRAGERAVRRLNPGSVKSGAMPVIFDPRIGSSLVSHLIGAIGGSNIARKTSFLLESLGEALFDSAISIIDDPLRVRGLGSRAFDGEGLPTARSAIIEKGVLTGWLLESAAARQLGLKPTGHASRGGSGAPGTSPANVHLEGGTLSVAELIADIDYGVYVHELSGQGVNGVTGDYSRGAGGFLIEKGEITTPVAEFTIASNLKDMYRALTAANDLEFVRSTNVPTLRVDGMMVASA